MNGMLRQHGNSKVKSNKTTVHHDHHAKLGRTCEPARTTGRRHVRHDSDRAAHRRGVATAETRPGAGRGDGRRRLTTCEDAGVRNRTKQLADRLRMSNFCARTWCWSLSKVGDGGARCAAMMRVGSVPAAAHNHRLAGSTPAPAILTYSSRGPRVGMAARGPLRSSFSPPPAGAKAEAGVFSAIERAERAAIASNVGLAVSPLTSRSVKPRHLFWLTVLFYLTLL